MEIDEKIVKEIFNIANMTIPEKISESDVMIALVNIKQRKDKDIKQRKDKEHTEDATEPKGESADSILVVDDIGVVTYQLKVLLTQIGYKVQVAKDVFGALNAFIKSRFDFIIMDLFVSTEQEGYTLLEEVKKLITKNNLQTKIIVITASNKTENKIKCLNGGADIFLKKETGWQDKLLEIIENHKFGMQEI